MDEHLNKTQRVIGSGLLGTVLLFGVGGIVVYGLEAEQAYQPDALYVEECGACHYAYPPGLLPAASWAGIMRGLEDHFEDNAETDDETAAYVSKYLAENALQMGRPSKWSMLLRNMPTEPPLRITDLPGFIQAHESELELLEGVDLSVGFFSPCEDCHRQADQGLFDKELLSKGYGPTSR
ncbi:MAG: hypothetical protein IIC59_01325 [Proteobacteria bacterium]|nr:hypothetical protein [Pseudomonadota bacterium]